VTPLENESWLALLESCQTGSADQSELLRRALLVSTADCVKVIGLDGRLQYLNPGGYQILEVQTPNQVLGIAWLEMWTGDARTAAEAAMTLAKQGGVGRFQGPCPTFAGTPRWWDVVISPMTDATGRVAQLLSVSRDITELKLAQLSQAREREILERLAAGEPVPEILESIAHLISADNPALNASILSWSPKNGQLTPQTQFLEELSFVLTGEQIRSASANIDHDIWLPLRRHLEQGGQRCCDIALVTDRDGAPAGMLLLTCKREDNPVISLSSRASWLGLVRLALKHSRHQEALVQNEARFAALARVSPVGIFLADASGARSFVNERWSVITGLSTAEAMGMGWTRAIHPDDRDAVLLSWQRAVASGYDFHQEYRLQNKHGKVTWVIGEATSAGQFGYIGTITDITDLKLAHDALVESSARFELLANNMSQLCWIADDKGWVFWYNQRWFDYTGTTLEQMQGWGWRAVHHPDYVDGVVERVSRCWLSGDDWEDTFPLRSKSGEYRWFLSRAKPVRDANGKVLRWFGTNTDVTELRQLEQSLELQNLALRRSNQELTQFAYVASHDLQEPLRTISNYAQMLDRHHGATLNEDARKSLNVIVDSSQRMSKLITDLLLYSRISSETLDAAEQIDLAVAVQDAKVMLAAPIREVFAEVLVGKLPVVRGTRTRLAQLFMNLIGNSLKYGRPGVTPRIAIDCRADGQFWRISVTDNGQGFAPEYSDRIFGIFKRLHGREIPGTGIGLALCRSIVERMGGSIGAEGRLGEGSTFWFTLPR
jgi:PAS domain S-box-containing protein